MPPPPMHCEREATAGILPPEHLLKAPLVGSGSSGGAMATPERRGKGMGSSAGSRWKKPAATGSRGETPLVNLSNLIGSPEFPIKETPATAATQPQRVARERKYTRPWSSSSSSPRDPSVRTGQQRRSAKTCHRRFSLLSINDAGSTTSPRRDNRIHSNTRAHLRNTAAAAAPSFRYSATRLQPLEKPGTCLSGGRMPSSPSASLSGGRSPSTILSGPRMPSSPSTSLSGARMLPSPRMTVKAGTGLSIETPGKHQAATGSPQKHQAVTGSQQTHESVTLSPQKHQAVTGSQQTHESVTDSPQKHQAVTSSNREAAHENQSVTGSNGETPPKHLTKLTVDGRSSGEMRQKKYRKEKIAPSQTIGKPSSLQRAETITERPTIREKKQQQKSNSEELTAEEKRRLTEEMAKKVQEADHVIQQLNKLGLGEDISNEELQRHFEQLPSEPPRVDTSRLLDDEQIRKLQVHHVLCLIKYHKCLQMTQQGHKNGLCDATLEDDYPLYHLEEKLKCFEEDETKLDGDHILDYLDKEGLLMYFEKDDIFGWSFQYCAVAALDDYQRLVPENYGGCEYVHWNVYCKYFHKYEIELEYLDFWEELSKNLKWMEGYIDIEWSTLKWRRICSRGESQAIKIAAGFKNITSNLAHAAYYELIDSMNVEFCWYKELDGVYFEIWKQVIKLKKSFREALDVVCKLDKFPLRQHVMEHALQTNDFEMEKQFRNCIEGIPEEVTEENARELIADAITKLRDRPKFYAQYIRRKIEIAKAVGMIPTVSL